MKINRLFFFFGIFFLFILVPKFIFSACTDCAIRNFSSPTWAKANSSFWGTWQVYQTGSVENRMTDTGWKPGKIWLNLFCVEYTTPNFEWCTWKTPYRSNSFATPPAPEGTYPTSSYRVGCSSGSTWDCSFEAIEDYENFSVKIDGTLPNSEITAPAGSSLQTHNFDVSVWDSDGEGSGLNSCFYRVYDSEKEWTTDWLIREPCNSSFRVTVDPGDPGANCQTEGIDTCTVYVYATDAVGNTGATNSRSFSIDWISPVSEITSPDDGSWQNGNFDVSVSDEGSGIENSSATCYYRIFDAEVGRTTPLPDPTRTCNSSSSFTVTVNPANPPEGNNCQTEGQDTCQARVWAVDNVGSGTSHSRYFSIDWTVPNPPTFNPTSRNWANTNVSVTVTYTDDHSGVQYTRHCWTTNVSCDPGTTAASTFTNGGTVTQSSTGAWTLCTRARDIAGNWSSIHCSSQGAYKIDKEKPTSIITSPDDGTSQTSPGFDVLVDDNDTGGSGLDICYYSIFDNGVCKVGCPFPANPASRSCLSPSSFTVTVGLGANCETEGENKCAVYVGSRDKASNASDWNMIAYDIILNQLPTAAISCDSTNCSPGGCASWTAYRPTANPSPCIYTFVNNSTDLDSTNCPSPCNNDIVLSKWYKKMQGEPDTAYTEISYCQFTGPDSCTLQQTEFAAGDYVVKLYVEDSQAASSSATQSFTMRNEVTADFMCSKDNTNWQSCETLSGMTQGEVVYLKDDSTYSDGATSIISRTWEQNDIPFAPGGAYGPNETLPSVILAGSTIKLTAVDDVNRSDYQEYSVNVSLPLPKWKEIKPF